MKYLLALGACVSVLGLAACGSTRPDQDQVRRTADYWSRMDDASALYLRGPKAQHTLQGDISTCAAQVKELIQLGAIRQSQPPRDMAFEPGLARGWDSPSKNGPLYSEYQNFTDFETCMNSRGWQRMENVTPVEADQATATWGEVVHGIMPTFKTPEEQRREERKTPAPSYNYNAR